jgi:hypothetical protein
MDKVVYVARITVMYRRSYIARIILMESSAEIARVIGMGTGVFVASIIVNHCVQMVNTCVGNQYMPQAPTFLISI